MNSLAVRVDRDAILNAWRNQCCTAEELAEQFDVTRDTVFYHLRRARIDCDPRAQRRIEQGPARRRRLKIEILSRLNLEAKSIARMVGVSERMVQIRLKEMSGA